jgi:signal transduction histidine kinase
MQHKSSHVEKDSQSGAVASGELQLVGRTVARISAATNIEEALRALLIGLRELTGAWSSVCLLQQPGQQQGPCTVYSWNGDHGLAWQVMPGGPDDPAVQVLLTGQSSYAPALAASGVPSRSPVRGISEPRLGAREVIVALHVGGHILGTLHVSGREGYSWGNRQLVACQALADHAASAVERLKLSHSEGGRGVLHDISSPLSTILGICEFWRDDLRLPAELRHDLEMVEAQAQRASDLLTGWRSSPRYSA